MLYLWISDIHLTYSTKVNIGFILIRCPCWWIVPYFFYSPYQIILIVTKLLPCHCYKFHANNNVNAICLFLLHCPMYTCFGLNNTTIWIFLLFYMSLSNNHWEIPLWRERSQLSFLKLGFVVTFKYLFTTRGTFWVLKKKVRS